MSLKKLALALLLVPVLGAPLGISRVVAQNEQFIPMIAYRTGPYAAGGSGFFSGYEDYLALLNARAGGINGVTLTWEECETGYNTDRGVQCYEQLKNRGPTGATVVQTLSTGITYRLIERATPLLLDRGA